ncbi:MAG: T9SS type A sorting domain-containing protein [Bacteroidota bacterium]
MKTKFYLFFMLFICNISTQIYAQTLTVDHNGDTADATKGDGICADTNGDCTLRAAIEEANANASITTITFGSAMTVSPATALPNISRSNLLVDGTAAPGASCGALVTGTTHSLTVVIDGSGQSSGNGLSVATDGVTIQGLVVQNCPGSGISINGNNNVVQCCYVGTDQTGALAAANSSHGITLGGINKTTTITNSLLSGNNGDGIYIGLVHAINATGNLIGTNATGDTAIPNQDGIGAFGSINCVIGGSLASDRNIISGNNDDGFDGGGTGSWNNAFYGNYIGTDINGNADLGNGGMGIRMHNGNNSYIIGGASAGEGNVISGNGSYGLLLMPSTTVLGNYIGTDATGTSNLGNDDSGVYLRVATTDCVIGNTGSGANIIAFNGGAGIEYASGGNGTGNLLQGNSIFSNSGLGIDLNGDGATANDADDTDVGPNNFQNYPDITDTTPNGSDIDVTFSVNSTTANTTYPLTIDFYKADSDSEEGQTWIGSVTYTAGEAATEVTKTLTPVVATGSGEILVATATDAMGNTSEFSPPVTNVLPVELSRFVAKLENSNAILHWVTASETNNLGFEVEQKFGSVWKRIGFVAGAGNSHAELHYTFRTNNLSAGQYYFRLRQMDHDGQFEFSNIVSVKMEEGFGTISFFPNPVANRAKIKTASEVEGAVQINLFSSKGRLVRQYFFEKTIGHNQWEIDLNGLSAGQYYLQMNGGENVLTRFVKQ